MAVVANDDGDEALSGVVTFARPGEPPEVDAALEDAGGGRFVGAVDGLDPSAAYQVTATLYEGDEAVDERSEVIDLGGGAATGIVDSKVRARSRKGAAGLRAITTTAWDVADRTPALSTRVAAGGEVVADWEVDESPAGVARDFKARLSFDGDPAEAEAPYAATVRALDGGGNEVEQVDVFVEVVEDKNGVLIITRLATDDTAFEGAELYLYRADGNEFEVGFAASGPGAGDVARAELTFDEPFEDPPPQENPVGLDFNAAYHRFQRNIAAAYDAVVEDQLSVEQNMHGDDGEVVEEVTFTGQAGLAKYKNGRVAQKSSGMVMPTRSLL